MIHHPAVAGSCRPLFLRFELANAAFLDQCARKTNRWKYQQKCLLRMAIFGLWLLSPCVSTVEAQSNTFPTPTGNVGIGTTTPDAKLVVTSNTATLPSSTGIARFAEADGVQTSVFLDGFNANGGFLMRRANTTAAAPSALLSGDLIGVLGAAGYGSSAYSDTRARIAFGAAENWTNSANGTFISFNTTAKGAATVGGTERMRIDSAGNIGLGTSDIETWTLATSVIESLNTSIFFGQVRDIHINSNAYHNSGWKYKGSSFGAANYYQQNGVHYWRVAPAGPADSAITWTDAMTLTMAGNFGIGTTSPSHRFDLHSSSQWVARFKKTDATNGGIIIEAATGYNPNLALAVNGTKKWYMNSNSSNSDSLQFWETTGTIPRFTLTQAGNVGIGTTNPGFGYRLDVQGGKINSSDGLCIAGVCKSAWSEVQPWTTSGSDLHFNTGNVGIGTPGPLSRLHVAKAAILGDVTSANQLMVGVDNTPGYDLAIGYYNVGAQYAGVLQARSGSSGSPLLLNPSGGNVGIGTTSAGAALHVAANSSVAALVLERADNVGGGGASFDARKARGTLTSPTILSSGDAIGDLVFRGYDGAAYRQAAMIKVNVDAAPGSLDMPGALSFLTTPDGASAPVERLRINNAGNVGIGTTTPTEILAVEKNQNSNTMVQIKNGTAGTVSQAGIRMINDADKVAQFGIYSSLRNPFGSIAGNEAYAYSSTNLVVMADSASGIIKFATGGSSEKMRIDAAGRVGIGTTPAAAYKLDVAGAINATTVNVNGTPVVSSQWTPSGSDIAYSAGRVGIGTTPAAAYKLDVAGAINATAVNVNGTPVVSSQWTSNGNDISYANGNVGIGTAGSPKNLHVTGNVTVDGIIHAKYQDVAEWVPSTHALPAGTVVTLDPTKSNHVEASSKAYDTRVAGVVSAQPGIALGEQGENKVLVATTGRVRIKVDASHGPIQVGDLLVSSNVAGVAMKSKPIDVGGVEIHRPGTLIGKALEPLAKGQGEILVLLSLQ